MSGEDAKRTTRIRALERKVRLEQAWFTFRRASVVITIAGGLLLLLVSSWPTEEPNGGKEIDQENVNSCVQQQQRGTGNIDLCY
ncbi:hypothetical protein [Synechococcus sp. CS-1328]|uniref:hypothetical protein n=1 Tax=Synechococcus sp. CS-1328 TaxID=2847976 RepID=UPI00223B6A0A|nr:hypothetical protein [Synechococcus sp. CS-1328]MCT0223805.1 hypothetical protein [Synechococcus sp. CS-1328]